MPFHSRAVRGVLGALALYTYTSQSQTLAASSMLAALIDVPSVHQEPSQPAAESTINSAIDSAFSSTDEHNANAIMAGLTENPNETKKPQYKFDSNLLLGITLSTEELDRLHSGTFLVPGNYILDIFLNDKFLIKKPISFVEHEKSKSLEPCLDRETLESNIKIQKNQIPTTEESCFFLKDIIPSSEYRTDINKLKIEITIPQAYLKNLPSNFAEHENLDPGETMLFVNYDTSLYVSSGKEKNSNTVKFANSSLAAGINLGLWRVRNFSNISYNSNKENSNFSWNNIRTYAQRAIPSINSELTIGESFTPSDLFGGINYLGFSLQTDPKMLPYSHNNYAPEVRGVATTAARVIISQDGRIIREENVPPGPFLINNLSGAASAGDLNVQILEADGTTSSFIVPYSAVPLSIRPGLSHYSITAGQIRDYGNSKDLFADAIYQKGINNSLTANAGLRVAEGYTAIVGGGVLATRFGALGLNTTYSNADTGHGENEQGWRVGLNYSKSINPTGTNFSLAGYRYSTRGFRELTDVIGSRAQEKSDDEWLSRSLNQKHQFTISVNQDLGNYGNFYISGSSNDYHDSRNREIQLQAGYSNTWKDLSYSLNWSRQSYRYDFINEYNYTNQRNFISTSNDDVENILTITLSMPLGRQSSRPASISSMASKNSANSGLSSIQTGISGAFGETKPWYYSASINHDYNMSQTAWNGSLQTHLPYARVNLNYAESTNYRQYGAALSGSGVLHKDGITLGPRLGETFALIEAKGAEGAQVKSANHARINRYGYALSSSLSPYRYNSIKLDPIGIPYHTELITTEAHVAPYSGSSVRVKFETTRGYPIIIIAKRPNNELIPIGSIVYEKNKKEVGLLGQGGQIYARVSDLSGKLIVIWGESATEQCTLDYEIPKNKNEETISKTTSTCN